MENKGKKKVISFFFKSNHLCRTQRLCNEPTRYSEEEKLSVTVLKISKGNYSYRSAPQIAQEDLMNFSGSIYFCNTQVASHGKGSQFLN